MYEQLNQLYDKPRENILQVKHSETRCAKNVNDCIDIIITLRNRDRKLIELTKTTSGPPSGIRKWN